MTATLKAHDRALRKALVAAHGYLSATEGDAWIAAFHSPTDAATFALLATRFLSETVWPPELLEHPEARTETQGDRAPPSLKVRVGAHSGAAKAERNEHSHAIEYSGLAFDLARAVGDSGKGGGVLLTGSTLALIDSTRLEEALGGPPAAFHAGDFRYELMEKGDTARIDASLIYLLPPVGETDDDDEMRGRALLAPPCPIRGPEQLR